MRTYLLVINTSQRGFQTEPISCEPQGIHINHILSLSTLVLYDPDGCISLHLVFPEKKFQVFSRFQYISEWTFFCFYDTRYLSIILIFYSIYPIYFTKTNDYWSWGRKWKLLCIAKVANFYPHLTLTSLQLFDYVYVQ